MPSLGYGLGRCQFERFPDGELHVEVQESVRGHDVYVIQPTSRPVDEQIMALLMAADACRRAGAVRLTAVVPYFGYARQDRRTSGREPVGARLVADLIKASGVQRVVGVDLHTASLEGFFGVPLEHLTAVPLLADAVRARLPADVVVVSPDLGAVRLAERYAQRLDAPVAVVHKLRISAEEVRVHGVVGDVRGRVPVVVDDMISTGGTIEAAVRALVAAGSAPEALVVASHALLVGPAVERLRGVPVRWLVATDSVPPPVESGLPLHTASLAPLLAEAITRLHRDESLSELLGQAHR
jgi:ribose-phosphate pyrophosphokinase